MIARVAARAVILGMVAATPLAAQSLLDRSPNLAGTWTVERGHAVFVFSHRLEFLNGGDELINFPTLSLALGLPLGFTAGLDYTSNSEAVPTQLGGNESEYWLKRAFGLGAGSSAAARLGYNSAAGSVDAALMADGRLGPVTLLGEVRGFSDGFGSGEPHAAVALGTVIPLTRYLGVAGDAGRVVSADSFPAVWSAGVAISIPGSPHTLSIHAANSGATTLQGASREKVIGPRSVRYGFAFTVPLGTGARWLRIFRGEPEPPLADTARAARVEMREISFTPAEVRVRAGESVEWLNLDPVAHTVTADDAAWESGFLAEGDRFVRRFDEPGRYPYHCEPHSWMVGVVVVEE
ncbi:MAG: cupredoxin domain-containing protein [Longimicrobiaceae bacterium]